MKLDSRHPVRLARKGGSGGVCSGRIWDRDLHRDDRADKAVFGSVSAGGGATACSLHSTASPVRSSGLFRQERYTMIKTILVPATGSDTDCGIFASALAVARPLGAHLGFIHIRLDAATFAATIMPEVSSGQVLTDMITRMEEEAEQREQKARQLVGAFCRREGLVLTGTQ
jgi:hypothetical protein